MLCISWKIQWFNFGGLNLMFQRIWRKYNIRIVIKSSSNLQRYSFEIKPHPEHKITKDYCIPSPMKLWHEIYRAKLVAPYRQGWRNIESCNPKENIEIRPDWSCIEGKKLSSNSVEWSQKNGQGTMLRDKQIERMT